MKYVEMTIEEAMNDCNYKEETQMERVMEINEADNYVLDIKFM